MKNILLIIGVAAVVLTSCTIEKRHYSSGYYVSFNHKNVKGETRPDAVQQEKSSSHETTIIVEEKLSQTNDLSENSSTAIVPPVTIEKEVAVAPHIATPSSAVDKQVVKESTQKEKSEKVNPLPTKSNSSAGRGKSQIVALLLCLFLGYLGIHRFYLGYTGLGLLYLFTLGLFGIGWLIDLILLIIPNGLCPKGKTSYKE